MPTSSTPGQESSQQAWLQRYQLSIPDCVSSITTRDLALPDDFQPSKNDVVCGRGRGHYNNAANVWFRNLVKSHLEAYNAKKSKAEKTAVLESIVKQVKERGSRFIKQDNSYACGWCELGDVAAREKVGNAVREAMSARNLKKTSSFRNMFGRSDSSSKSLTASFSKPNPQNQPARVVSDSLCRTSCSSCEDSEMTDVVTPLRRMSLQRSLRKSNPSAAQTQNQPEVFGRQVASLENSQEYKDHSLQMMDSSTFSSLGDPSSMMVEGDTVMEESISTNLFE